MTVISDVQSVDSYSPKNIEGEHKQKESEFVGILAHMMVMENKPVQQTSPNASSASKGGEGHEEMVLPIEDQIHAMEQAFVSRETSLESPSKESVSEFKTVLPFGGEVLNAIEKEAKTETLNLQAFEPHGDVQPIEDSLSRAVEWQNVVSQKNRTGTVPTLISKVNQKVPPNPALKMLNVKVLNMPPQGVLRRHLPGQLQAHPQADTQASFHEMMEAMGGASFQGGQNFEISPGLFQGNSGESFGEASASVGSLGKLLPHASSLEKFTEQILGKSYSETPATQISRMLRSVPHASRSYEINLEPQHLGGVQIALEFSKSGEITVMVWVEKPETLDLLQKDTATLHQSLVEAGFDVIVNSREVDRYFRKIMYQMRDGKSIFSRPS